MRSEKIIHDIRSCVQTKPQGDEDFSDLKIHFLNAFNHVSRDALFHDEVEDPCDAVSYLILPFGWRETPALTSYLMTCLGAYITMGPKKVHYVGTWDCASYV